MIPAPARLPDGIIRVINHRAGPVCFCLVSHSSFPLHPSLLLTLPFSHTESYSGISDSIHTAKRRSEQDGSRGCNVCQTPHFTPYHQWQQPRARFLYTSRGPPYWARTCHSNPCPPPSLPPHPLPNFSRGCWWCLLQRPHHRRGGQACGRLPGTGRAGGWAAPGLVSVPGCEASWLAGTAIGASASVELPVRVRKSARGTPRELRIGGGSRGVRLWVD